MPDPSQQQLVAIAIDNYLTNPERLTKEERSKSNKIIDHYAKTNEHAMVVKQIFLSLKQNLNKQNFSNVCKRFLILVDDILEVSQVKPIYKPYASLISKQLVECFLYVFSLIFQYQLHQASLDWKVYRMLWAKSIDDDIFDALRIQISHKHRNFDLNRGFTQQSIDRIKKRYNRKGFTEQEIKRYMEGNKIQPKRPSPKIQMVQEQVRTNNKRRSESSSSNEQLAGRKKDPRMNYAPYQRKQIQTNRYQNYNYQENQPYPQQYRPQNAYIPVQHVHSQPMNLHPSTLPPSMPQKPMVPPPTMVPPPNMVPPPTMVPPQPYLGYSQPPTMFPPTYHSVSPYLPSNSPFPSPYHSPYRSPDRSALPLINSKKSQPQTEVMSMDPSHTILRKKLLESQHECRQCGQLFICKQNLNRHTEQHLNEAQRQLESREFSKANENQTNTSEDDRSSRLLSVEEWNDGFRNREEEAPQQITVQNIPMNKGKYHCHFCQEELELNWCPILEDWSLAEAIRVRERDGHITVAHLGCYQEFVPAEGRPEMMGLA